MKTRWLPLLLLCLILAGCGTVDTGGRLIAGAEGAADTADSVEPDSEEPDPADGDEALFSLSDLPQAPSRAMQRAAQRISASALFIFFNLRDLLLNFVFLYKSMKLKRN